MRIIRIIIVLICFGGYALGTALLIICCSLTGALFLPSSSILVLLGLFLFGMIIAFFVRIRFRIGLSRLGDRIPALDSFGKHALSGIKIGFAGRLKISCTGHVFSEFCVHGAEVRTAFTAEFCPIRVLCTASIAFH